MKIAIYSQHAEKHSNSILLELFSFNNKYKIDFFLEKQFEKELVKDSKLKFNYNVFSKHKDLDNSFDLMITIGGDGTLLRSISFVRDLEIPIIGINTGRLGFLATIQKEKITESLHQILNGNYILSERSLLSIYTSPNNKENLPLNFALNEIAVNRKNTTSMIKVETMVNNKYLTSYWSDGLIISTPTGSTGYSLSCGGPILDPNTNSIVITPIAPHNLNARPLVVPDNSIINLKVSGRGKSHLVSLDSRIATLKNETLITIKKAPFKIKLVQLSENSFIKTLRKKLLWGEDKRN